MSATQLENNSGTSAARRLRAIRARTHDPDLADAIDEVAALKDRLLYAECALHHICDRLGIDERTLPDPLMHLQPVEVPT